MESTLHTEQSDNVPQHQLYRLSQSRSYVYLESVFSGSKSRMDFPLSGIELASRSFFQAHLHSIKGQSSTCN